MKFKKIPENTFQQIQLNAGILVPSFNPATGVVGTILGATSGGVNFSGVPTYKDYGEDIDNCPKNTKELKKLESWEVKLSGTFVQTSAALAKRMLGAADIDSTNTGKIIPRNDLLSSDFSDLWWIGDYSDKNGEENGGYVAIHMMNSLSTAGFAIQSTDKEKGKFAFEFTAHYSINAQDTVPFELYIIEGTAEPGTYTLTYNSNGGTGTMTDANSPYQAGATATVKANTFTYSGKTFQYWATQEDGGGSIYGANFKIRMDRNITLYAVWA